MEPNNNLENQFRDKLNAREIQPSLMAWDRLDAMLTVAENKKPKRKWNWLLIAAGFVGILFAGLTIYQFQSSEIEKGNKIVDQENMKANKNSNLKNNYHQIIIYNKAVAEINSKLSKNDKISKINSSKKEKINQINQNLISNKSIISQKTTSNENENQLQITQINQKTEATQKTTINVNSDVLLAQIETLQTPKPDLLPQQIKVNANSLLSEVDGEVTQEFRETKLSKLKRNFQSVKSALVSRNDK